MKTILVIDDDEFTGVFLEELLGGKYAIRYAANGQDGVNLALASPPTLILLDVEMPLMDGYAACRLLKASSQTSDVPVIFLSAHVETADRLAGYEAGGDDYMTKPFDSEELMDKIGVVLRNRDKNQELAKHAHLATRTAMTAMSAVEDMGIVLTFLRQLVGCSDLSQLASTILQVFQDFGLEVAIQLRDSHGALSRNRNGLCSPLEEAVLHNMAAGDRIIDLGSRSAFNYERCSIIVKNMPRDDEDRHANIRNDAAIIAESVDAQLRLLDLMLNAVGRGDKLLGVLHQITKALRDFEKHYIEQRQESGTILNQLVEAVENSFLFLGLTDTQETYLQDITRDAVAKAQALYKDAEQADALMSAIGENLGEVLGQELRGAVDAADGGSRIEVW